MPRIQQLPPAVVAKIAAGEVIERPASVVKELLENALDAGGTRVDVDIEQGGAELVRVVDDGCGIQSDDLPLAFASHATSKLADADDLFRVRTLGFRGEALASIGGVARVTLQSRPPGRACGAEVRCEGGSVAAVREWNGAPGTRVEVRQLFYNTPVRRKFLRTVTTEMGHICEAFTRLALARERLHLTLRHNGKHVYEVPATATVLDRLGLFFGADTRDRLYPVQAQAGPVILRGFVADPACERGNARSQYLFVNGRCVRDRSLGHALQEAYRGLLMTGRYAVAFLFLELPPDLVDVNVHPTKAEVRFRDGHGLYHLVLASVREVLRKANLTARLRVPDQGLPVSPMDRRPPTLAELANGMGQPLWNSTLPPAAFAEAVGGAHPTKAGDLKEEGSVGWALPTTPDTPTPLTAEPGKAIQVHDAYLLLETPEGVLVIDQHALHERILFEQLKRRHRAGELETQRLLIPEPVDLPAEQASRALEQREALAELGLQIEDFGGGTLLLSSYPALLGSRSPQKVLRAVVDHLMAKERLPSREQLLNDLLSLMACHAAVKAGDRLTAEEVAALVAQRHLAEDTHHCPHGRPTSLLFSRQELDRQFRRI